MFRRNRRQKLDPLTGYRYEVYVLNGRGIDSRFVASSVELDHAVQTAISEPLEPEERIVVRDIARFDGDKDFYYVRYATPAWIEVVDAPTFENGWGNLKFPRPPLIAVGIHSDTMSVRCPNPGCNGEVVNQIGPRPAICTNRLCDYTYPGAIGGARYVELPSEPTCPGCRNDAGLERYPGAVAHTCRERYHESAVPCR